jgi:hypothetical protein
LFSVDDGIIALKLKKYMRALLLALLGTCMVLGSYAQSNKEDVDLIQAMYGKEKKTIVADFIVFPDDTKKAAFWKLYDDYEAQRKAYGQKRIAILEKYANAYETMDDKSGDEIIRETIRLQKDVDGLIAGYYEKIRKGVGGKQAGQFFQIESYFLSATRLVILENIPFIGELDIKK